MADKTPIVLDGAYHKPLAAGDTIPGYAVKLAAQANNAIYVDGDGGLMVSTADIASIFTTCGGLAHTPGASIPTCAEMEEAIDAAIGSLPVEEFLKLVQYDPATHTLTFEMEGGDEYQVNLSDLLPVVVDTASGLQGNGTIATPLALSTPEATAPAESTGTDVPTAIVGGRTQMLGQPDGWMTINGKKLPYWN